MQLLSYHNDPELKTQFLNEIRLHKSKDAFIKGEYGDSKDVDFKGCAIGCSIYSLNKLQGEDFSVSDHSAYESLVGFPEWLARLEDTIFEGLDINNAKLWPLQFSEAIPVGVDLESVKWKFCSFLMQENINRVNTLEIEDDLKAKIVNSIKQCKSVHDVAIKTGKWDTSAASAADSAASAAYSASAARSAAAAASAASAAYSASAAAYSASAAASAASAASAAASAAYIKYSEKLIELLKEA